MMRSERRSGVFNHFYVVTNYYSYAPATIYMLPLSGAGVAGVNQVLNPS
jgi:hypothetical protein